MKEKQDVISDFNELVNMTGSELESWLKSDDSNSAGWPKSDGDEDGESVGHESGRKIVEILNSNPKKDAEKYTDDQVEHMRKVVAYCKRHLAQETAGNNDKSEEEVKKTKSYASLKNWGHDFLKAKGKGGGKDSETSKPSKKKGAEDEEDAEGDAEEEVEEVEEVEEAEETAGSKRKQTDEQDGPSKKRETHKGESKSSSKDKDEEEDKKDENEEDDVADEGEDVDKGANGKANGSGKEHNNGPSKGDTVSWNWGSGQPEGKVIDVQEDTTSITTKRGNEVSKNGTAEDPAVVIDTGKSEAVKLAHELN